MDHFIDRNFAILEGTLLSAIGSNSTELVIPSKVGGHAIRRICNGCAVGRNTEYIIISEGIREFGKEAFINCKELKRLEFPESLEKIDLCDRFINTSGDNANLGLEIILKRFFPKYEYEALMRESIPLQSGERLMGGDYMEHPQFSGILKKISSLRPAARIRPEMGRVFIPDDWSRGCRSEQILFQDGGEAVDAGERFDQNDTAPRLIPILIRDHIPALWDDDMELEGDKRMQQKAAGSGTADNVLLTFLQSVTEDKKGVHAVFRIRIGKAFFPAVVRLICHGKAYYIYRVFYLTGDNKKPYIRKDYPDRVYNAAGRVVYKPEVYAKYRFMSIFSETMQDNSGTASLVGALVEEASFLERVRSLVELSAEQRNEAAGVVKALFRLPDTEQTMQGMHRLLKKNRSVVKQLFFMTDDPGIDSFLLKNSKKLGLGIPDNWATEKKHMDDAKKLIHINEDHKIPEMSLEKMKSILEKYTQQRFGFNEDGEGGDGELMIYRNKDGTYNVCIADNGRVGYCQTFEKAEQAYYDIVSMARLRYGEPGSRHF